MRAMFHLGVLKRCFIFLFKLEFHLGHYPADDEGSTACATSQNRQRRRAFAAPRRIARSPFLVTTESKYRRNTGRPWSMSMFAEWGLKSKRILVVGCSRVKIDRVTQPLQATMT